MSQIRRDTGQEVSTVYLDLQNTALLKVHHKINKLQNFAGKGYFHSSIPSTPSSQGYSRYLGGSAFAIFIGWECLRIEPNFHEYFKLYIRGKNFLILYVYNQCTLYVQQHRYCLNQKRDSVSLVEEPTFG